MCMCMLVIMRGLYVPPLSLKVLKMVISIASDISNKNRKLSPSHLSHMPMSEYVCMVLILILGTDTDTTFLMTAAADIWYLCC